MSYIGGPQRDRDGGAGEPQRELLCLWEGKSWVCPSLYLGPGGPVLAVPDKPLGACRREIDPVWSQQALKGIPSGTPPVGACLGRLQRSSGAWGLVYAFLRRWAARVSGTSHTSPRGSPCCRWGLFQRRPYSVIAPLVRGSRPGGPSRSGWGPAACSPSDVRDRTRGRSVLLQSSDVGLLVHGGSTFERRREDA